MPKPETIAWLQQSAALDGSATSRTLLEILERLERLERLEQRPTVAAPAPAPAGLSLIDELALAISVAFGDDGAPHWRPEARRVVAVIVRRLRERNTIGYGMPSETASWLEQEAAK